MGCDMIVIDVDAGFSRKTMFLTNEMRYIYCWWMKLLSLFYLCCLRFCLRSCCLRVYLRSYLRYYFVDVSFFHSCSILFLLSFFIFVRSNRILFGDDSASWMDLGFRRSNCLISYWICTSGIEWLMNSLLP